MSDGVTLSRDMRDNRYVWPCLWLFVFYFAALFLNGPATTDIPDFLTISRDTTKVLAPVDRQLFYSSPLNFFLGDFLHLVSVPGFFLIHVTELILMVLCAGIAIGKKFALAEDRLQYAIFISLTPLWLITFKWIGKTDPVLIGGFFLCWAFQSRWRILIITVMIIAHRELGSLMTLMLYFLEGRKDHNLLWALVPGNAFHLIYEFGILDYVPGSRAGLMASKSLLFLTAFGQLPMIYIMSTYSWYWIFILLEKPNKTELLAYCVAIPLALINEDFTRDFTLAALPITIFHCERVVRSGKYRAFKKLYPLTAMHVQVAAMGHIFAPNNSFSYLLYKILGNTPV